MSEERKPIYGLGDKVRIVNYGQLMWHGKKGYAEEQANAVAFQKKWEAKIWLGIEKDYPIEIDENVKPKNIISEDEDFWWCDWRPEQVGKEGLIQTVSNTQNIPSYSIQGIGAWYNEEQLELVKKNQNNL